MIHTLLSGDAEIADMLGEVVDSGGPDGAILIEDAQGIHPSHEYIDGVRFIVIYHPIDGRILTINEMEEVGNPTTEYISWQEFASQVFQPR